MNYRFMRFPQGKTKAVTFSYDDGVLSDLRFSNILDKYGMKGTFNVNSAFVLSEDRKDKLNIDQLNDLLSRGHEIALHTHSHKAPGLFTPAEATLETLECRVLLEKALGRIIRGMAYPDSGILKMHNGNDYETIRSMLQTVGVAYSRTLRGDNNHFDLPSDWYSWLPSIHHDNPKAFDYIDEFLSIDVNGMGYAGKLPRLFYVWGHTFEFDRKNNWDRIEDICTKLSGKDEIWYATNIEIYDYVKAYESLVISADGTLFYNPTVTTVWFYIKDTLYSVSPGETVRAE